MVRLRLTSRGKRSDDLMADIDAATAVLRKALGGDLMDGSSKPIEHYVGKLLMDRGLTVGTAESWHRWRYRCCTSEREWSSAYFEGSVVAYSYDIKETLLGVDHDTIVSKGAVSEEVVRQMSEGARKIGRGFRCGEWYCGPGGGTPDKPVGTRLD